MSHRDWLARHGPFALLVVFLFVLAVYVDRYLDAFTYILLNSRLFFQLFVGITAIAAVRNIAGVKAFGAFGPAIIAVAFLQAGLLFGALLLLNILAIVIATRELIRRELIQQDHRIAILVILVGLSIVLLEILAEYFHYPSFDYSFLFPVLILAWTAERYVEEVDRTGWELPSRKLFWTLGLVLLAFGVMAQAWLVDAVILTPLSWPLLVLANWYLGTHVRFRISERFRFRPTTARPDGPVPPDDVLTMNVRNREYIAKYNPPERFAYLTKARAKDLLASHGVPVPETHILLEGREDLGRLEAFLREARAFVVKPAQGHGGEGILVVRSRRADGFDTNQGPMSAEDIVEHAQYVLTGAFGGDGGDVVLVEALVEQHASLRELVPEGLADVRVIALLGFPAMAMARLPTRESKGRANLHSGAVGCGIELSTGRIVHATWRGRPVTKHPDTGARIVGTTIPFWSEILDVATQAQVVSGLGYAGIDVVLDAARGPLVLEVNRRPGLEIQNANRAGLLRRLRAIERLRGRGELDDRVGAAMDLDVGGWEAPA
ncbi:MAG TPA: sugar-transfer associated ATP-grasp domain-containing protein [Thermoplasmata archaeon]|nr:sugar-transfer associated ATP-grasp domain-containing protein [Thermoplasmata archaeon]